MFKSLLEREWIILLLWVLLGWLGANERVSSKKFENYISSSSYAPDPGLAALIGNSPVVVLLVNMVVFVILLQVYKIFYYIFSKEQISKTKKIILFSTFIIFLLLTCIISIENLFEMLTWGFYISASQSIIWLLFSILLTHQFWKLINN
jgi:hypothetical protein